MRQIDLAAEERFDRVEKSQREKNEEKGELEGRDRREREVRVESK